MLLALAVFSSGTWAQAGFVHEVSGIVSMQKGAATAVQAKAGDTFESETVFRTTADGKLTLKFADGQVVALGDNSSLRVGRYHYDAASRAQNRSTLELIKGEMRFVTGLIGTADRESVRITAGESMIAILKSGGADFTVSVNPGPQEVGYAVVAQGEISVRTPYGPIQRIASDQYAPWRPGRTPGLPLPAAAAPAIVHAATAGLWAAVLPSSTPGEVASAASKASATAAIGPAIGAVGAERAPAGFVEALSNAVSLRTGSGGTVTPRVGTTFEAGTTFDTGTNGRVVLKFGDGQVVVLGPASTLAVSQYQFDPTSAGASKAALGLTNGSMRVVTGAIHAENREGINITAGDSAVRILNTGPADFTVVVTPKGKAAEVGVARVSLGEIGVSTPYGPIESIKAEQSNLWGPKTPTSPIPVATALAVVQAAVTLQLSGLPDTAPVAVVPAARAAAAIAQANQARAAAAANPQNTQLQAAAQGAAELAKIATQAAAAAAPSEPGLAARAIATMLQDLPPTAAGPVLAQAPAAPAAPAITPIPVVLPASTPGAGGGCTGSRC